jgi:hypothetical protein
MEGIVQSSMTTLEVEFVRCVICTSPSPYKDPDAHS